MERILTLLIVSLLIFETNAQTITVGETVGHSTMGFEDSAVVIPMIQDSFSRVQNPTGTLYTPGQNSTITNIVGDSIQVRSDGLYMITWSLGYSGANNDIYHVHIFINSVIVNTKGASHRGMSSSDVAGSGSTTILDLNENDWISLQIENTVNNNDATMVVGDITVLKIR